MRRIHAPADANVIRDVEWRVQHARPTRHVEQGVRLNRDDNDSPRHEGGAALHVHYPLIDRFRTRALPTARRRDTTARYHLLLAGNP